MGVVKKSKEVNEVIKLNEYKIGDEYANAFAQSRSGIHRGRRVHAVPAAPRLRIHLGEKQTRVATCADRPRSG